VDGAEPHTDVILSKSLIILFNARPRPRHRFQQATVGRDELLLSALFCVLGADRGWNEKDSDEKNQRSQLCKGHFGLRRTIRSFQLMSRCIGCPP
jgi:hypothetical protein